MVLPDIKKVSGDMKVFADCSVDDGRDAYKFMALGMAIVFVVPGTLWLKFVIAYAVSQIILSLSGTGFAPMVSAIVLPVMLGTRTPLYLLSAFLFTTIILLVRTVFEKTSVCNRISYHPLERQPFVFKKKRSW